MQLTVASSKIWVYHEPVDFRKSINGLSEIVIHHFDINITEAVFIFFNTRQDKVKVLAWHGNGFILLYKRLEQGRFSSKRLKETPLIQIDERQFSWLLAGLNWQ